MAAKKPSDLLALEFDPRNYSWNDFTSHCAEKYGLGDVSQIRKTLEPWFGLPAYQLFDNEDWGPAPNIYAAKLIAGKGGGPISKVIRILEDEDNWGHLTEILQHAGDEFPSLWDVTRALQAIEWHLKFPAKWKKKDNFLDEFVGALAAFWRTAKGTPFKQNWHRQSSYWIPLTNSGSAEFVYTVIYYYNPVFIPRLRHATQRVVSAAQELSKKWPAARKRVTARKRGQKDR